MARNSRSPSTFWQRPVVIATLSALVLALAVGSYLVTRPQAVANVDALNAAAQSSASVAQASMTAEEDANMVAHTAAFIGDSYTAAAGATATGKGFTTGVARTEGWTERNLGVGGTGYGRYSEVIADAVKLRPGIVVVGGGRNDVTLSAATEATAVSDFYTALRKALPTARLIAISPLWDSTEPPAVLARIAGQVRASVQSAGGTYLDIGQPLSGRRDWVISDGVHPNDKGHAAIAAAIEKALLATGIASPVG